MEKKIEKLENEHIMDLFKKSVKYDQMKREIKFRAWDGTKYITFDNHQYDLIYNDISGWNICPNLPNYKGEWTTGESSRSAKSFKLEQFTGLKDKNGVDIYEGDILNIGTVVFERGTFGVYPEYTDEFVPVAEWSSESRQIIGSIHELKKRPNN